MGKHNHKLVTLTLLTAAATGVIYAANRFISASAILKEILEKPSNTNYYKWRFGNVFYRKTGQGEPLLLLHDLTPGGSGYEWNKIIDPLSEKYTVYTLDLLGCGRSDKPEMTYTNFVYVQLLCDFIRDVIGTKTSVIASGLSGSFVIMACNSDSGLFDKNILVNPPSLVNLNRIPESNTKAQKMLLEFPVFGTMLYHILVSKFQVENLFLEKYFFNPFHADRDFIESYYEAAHIGDGKGKYLCASLAGRYLNFNILHGLKSTSNSIYLVGGKYEPGMIDIMEDYTHYNPSIESVSIDKAKHFPHIERPSEFLEYAEIYLSDDKD